MNIASYLFAWILATLLGALFHLWRDGGFWKLLFYIGLSWAGFFVGHLIASSINFTLMTYGSVHLAGGILGSLVFLFVGHWLGRINASPDK